jgi:hypothetical protein
MADTTKIKFDIVLTNDEWEQLRPCIKTLQEDDKLTYSAQGYTADKVLIICECKDAETEATIDQALKKLLGHVYA